MSRSEVLVLDTSDPTSAKRLLYALIANVSDPRVRDSLRDVKFAEAQKALRFLLPPELEEPMGLAALVKDAEGTLWVRVCRHRGCNSWRRMEDSDVVMGPEGRRHWEEILSKGELSS